MKKLISVLLCICMLLASLSVAVFAVEVTETIVCGSVEAYSFPEDIPDSHGTIRPKKFYSNGSGPFLFRNQLTDSQKKLYDAIVSCDAGINDNGSIVATFGSTDITASDTSTLDTNLLNTVYASLSAVIDDYPEYFWIGSFSFSYSRVSSGGQYYVSRVTLSFSEGFSDFSNYSSAADMIAAYNNMLYEIENFEIKGESRYEKVKSIHDSIANMTTYNEAAMAHHPTGVFLNGVAVCEGYAEAFKLLCDREKIPCILVNGVGVTNSGSEGHEWNLVQMEDGYWYGLDVTWDDQTDGMGIFYDYFLVGSDTHASGAFGDRQWSVSHEPDGSHWPGDLFILSYPTLASTSYSAIMPLFNADVTFDAPNNLLFIGKDSTGKDSTLNSEFWFSSGYSSYAPSDNAANISGNTTGATVTITSPVNRTYTVARWGDVNADNNVNDMDKDLIKGVVLCEENVTISGIAEVAAADFNHDGVIDGFDAVYMELYLNKAVSK
ncbi:MAG: hypothetical protein K5761_00640 [Clostridiales bacterium]|nr:hypothetical protein [Clostridiales bacterium]